MHTMRIFSLLHLLFGLVSGRDLALRRFPKRDTEEFKQQCGWTMAPPARTPSESCTILAVPLSQGSEGLARWVSSITQGLMMSKLTGCKYHFDALPQVDLQAFWDAHDDLLPPHEDTWKTCGFRDKSCYKGQPDFHWDDKELKRIRADLGDDIPQGINYRRIMAPNQDLCATEDSISQWENNLPGFSFTFGFPCAMEYLMGEPSIKATEFESELFSSLLPTLRDPDNLVLGVYVRTLSNDPSLPGSGNPQQTKSWSKSTADSAQKVEELFLAEEGPYSLGLKYKRVIWIVISDEPTVKTFLKDLYDGKKVTQEGEDVPITRSLLWTNAKGSHTRGVDKADTRAYAEAYIDWYLLGETDAVILSHTMSFGQTGAMRTLRPIFYTSSIPTRQLPYIKESQPLPRPKIDELRKRPPHASWIEISQKSESFSSSHHIEL